MRKTKNFDDLTPEQKARMDARLDLEEARLGREIRDVNQAFNASLFGCVLGELQNETLRRLWARYQQRVIANPELCEFLKANTRASGIIDEAFRPHDRDRTDFCAVALLEAVRRSKGGTPVGLKYQLKNDVQFPDFGRFYDLVYAVVESACLAHRCNHEGECRPNDCPADPTETDREDKGFVNLIDGMRGKR